MKSSRLSVQPSSDDELSSSHPNVCLSGGNSAADAEPKSSRVQTPSSGTFTADEEELKATPHGTAEERKPDGTDEDSGSGGSVDDPGPRGRPRIVDHRWRSLDRRTTSAEWDARRRSTDHVLDSPELSKRAAIRFRSADPQTSPDPRISAGSSPTTDTDVLPQRSDVDVDEEKSTEDLTLDIDSALAEVMSEIESLGLGHVMFSGDRVETEKITPPSPSTGRKTQTSTFGVPRQDFEDAPDLVIGLPVSSTGTQSSPKNLLTDPQPASTDGTSSLDSVSGHVTSPSRSLTAAEMFANANQSTIKKAAVGSSQPVHPTTSSVEPVPSLARPTPAYRARSVDAASVLTSDGVQRSSSPPARRPHPVPKAKPARRSDVGSKPFPTPADIRPDVEFVRAIVPPFGDADAPTRTFTLPRESDLVGRGRPDSSDGRPEVSRSMSVGDATAAVASAGLRPPPGAGRDPSPAGKPPVKVKPPVMKKPARAGEVIKRLQESLAQQSGVSVSAPQ